jgi:hypothetical protein
MINGITLNSLRNAEFIQFIKGILAIILSNGPAALNVQVQYDSVQAMLTALETLFITEQGSAITADISALDARRDRAITGFTLLVNALTYHFNPDTAKQAETLKKLFEKYGSGIARENYQAETAIIDNLIADLNNKPEMAAAINALQLNDWQKEMQTANTAFDAAYLLRTQQLGAASKDTLFAKRQETNEAYYKLRNFIDSFFTINEGAAPYGKTTNELNAHIDQYNTMMAGRLGNGGDEPPTPPAA